MKNKVVLFVILLIILLPSCGGNKENSVDVLVDKSMQIQSESDTLFVGETETMTCVLIPEESQIVTTDVIWRSSNPDVASIDNKGVVKGISTGNVTIIAVIEAEQLQAETSLTVVAHVTNIQLDKNEVELLLGTDLDTVQLKPIVIPENAFIQDLSLTSSSEGIATVDENGTVRAVSPGTAEIRIQSKDVTCDEVAVCIVTVRQGVQSISLNDDNIELYLGDEYFLLAEAFPENADNASCEWTSLDTSVASVDSDGRVYAVGEGATTISCNAVDGGGARAECIVRTIIAVESLSITNAPNSLLLLGKPESLGSCQLEYEVFPKNATYSDVIWISSDESVATVDENGFVQAVSPGKVTITASSTDPRADGGIIAAHDFSVETAVQSIEVSGLEYNVVKGTFRRLSATILPQNANNKNVAWSSSNDNVMTVDNYGNINAVGVGRVTITCEALDGSGAVTRESYNVYQPVKNVTVTEGYSVVIFKGQQKQLNAEVSPSDASNKKVNWESSDTSIAQVNQQGIVTAKSEGTVYITATADDGSGKSFTVTLYVEPVNPVSIEGVGFGIYYGNMIAYDIKNHCSKLVISNIHFDIDLTSYDGTTLVTSGSYKLGAPVYIGPGSMQTVRGEHSGVSSTYSVKITVTAVDFTDGSQYFIPTASQKTVTFTR